MLAIEEALVGLINQSGLEILAMLLGLAYLVFIIRENILAWPCAFLSTSIYIYVFWEAALLMESLLNVYYLLMAIYGFWYWSLKRQVAVSELAISRWPWHSHAIAIFLVLLVSAVNGYFLSEHTQAAWPYIDSFTTWGAVLTTYMVARKVYESWHYWLVIDSVALCLYIERGLYPTALLMAVYLCMVVVGMRRWRTQLNNQSSVNA
jgi:nicotinamide mononucleotide transporter